MLCTILPAQLWLHRNDVVFRNHQLTNQEITARVWKAATEQIEAVASAVRATSESAIQGICLLQLLPIVLDPAEQRNVLQRPMQYRLHFDGGARGNPGPGGAGWVVSILDERATTWEMVTGGHMYTGPAATNNESEITGLILGLRHLHRLDKTRGVHLTIVGDSQLLIRAFNGTATLRSPKLVEVARQVKSMLTGYLSIRWRHVRRTFNTAADLLANIAMNTKETGTINGGISRAQQTRRILVEQKLKRDNGIAPPGREEPFTKAIRMYAKSIEQ